MKTNFKNKQELSRRSIMIIGVLFFATMLVSARNSEMPVDTEGDNGIEIKEVELKLEKWMLNADLFQKMINKDKTFFAFEKELVLESWMLEPEQFNKMVENKNVLESVENMEHEEVLELEPWMLDFNKF